MKGIWGISVSMVTRILSERPGLDFRRGQGIFLYAIASRLDLGPSQPPIQWLFTWG